MIAAVLFALQFKTVQTYVAQKAANYLSKELETKISIKSLYIKPFKSIVLEDLLVLDLQNDTLLSTPKFLVDINDFSLKRRVIDIQTVQISSGRFFFKEFKDDTNNIDFIINYFDTGDPKVDRKKKKPFEVKLGKVIFNDFAFKYKNYKHYQAGSPAHINFDDIDLKALNGIFEGFDTDKHLLKTRIKNLTFKEKSGFYLKNLSTLAVIDTNAIELNELSLVTNQSRLGDYYKMNFKSFKDFNDYIDKVRMTARFKNSFLASRDVAYFAPELADWRLNLEVDGAISGKVGNLRAKGLTLKAGASTFIKADLSMMGLPNWDETFMNVTVDMASSNKADLETILAGITGAKGNQIPEEIKRFGNINFKGNFTGFQNDFIAYGEFKTALGRFESDINMKIKNNFPSYSGNVKTYDFDIGTLINDKSLHRISSSLYVKGSGTEFHQMTENVKGEIKYIDFNNYRYTNIEVNGKLAKKQFEGILKMDDRNAKLRFEGSVNLQPKLPVFQFNALIRDANLHALRLTDDSLQVDATFKTNFAGTNINNLVGELRIDSISLTNPRGIFTVDSVMVKAEGEKINRTLQIQSDILTASIKGDYDLNSIVSYYKTIAKRYIPSLQTDIQKHNPQIFTFDLKIKRFEPLAQLLIPGLEMEQGAVLQGQFDSRENIANLNGYIEKLKYSGIVFNNIILDESLSDKQLQLVVTTDVVNLTDSLYIKDLNISNILRNDSLALNIKMSNGNESNQLDLNALVEFVKDPDTIARLSIIPSVLKVNEEKWLIQEKARIVFNNGKTFIDNFGLSNEQQHIRASGILSEDASDELLVNFENFDLRTLNPFTKTMGAVLAGKLNGVSTLNGVLKTLSVRNDMRIDSLGINGVEVGELKDLSAYNGAEKAVTVLTNVQLAGSESLHVAGNFDIDDNTIDMRIGMKDSEIAIFEPFVNNLVSNLRGTLTADINIKGQLKQPNINGTAAFSKAELTVNYLKTRYVLNDKLDIAESTLKLKNFRLKDIEGNEGIANGTVDLKNLDDPTIHVDIKAKDLLALNTTAKDNSVYYGKAYGTGDFSFNGPTSRMQIDITAKTEKGTVFNLPLNSTETVSDKDFIYFVQKDTTKVQKKTNNFDGLTLNFKLTVDPNSTANIYTALGKLSGKGNADLALNINSLGNFEMYGDYIIETGSFDFTAQEIINKKFDIRQGGSIRWTGNPTAAQIQLKAIYALRANLNDLYKAANRELGSSTAAQRENTEVEMALSGLLLKPDIKLDINFPSQPAIKEELQNYFSDQNNLNLQAFSLIIRRSFAPGTGGESIGKQLGSTAQTTATELLFNQFNNVLSSLNLNFVDLNIRSLNEANASVKLFNDRLIINAGVVDRSIQNDLGIIDFSKENLGTEVEVLALIKKDGSLVAKLANKPPTRQSIFVNSGISPTANVTSVGLMYTQQFDTFGEFFRRLTSVFKKKEAAEKAADSAEVKKVNSSVNIKPEK